MGDTTPAGENGRDAEEADRLADIARELQDSASALISRTWSEEQALRQRALALDSDLRRLQSAIDSAVKNGSLDPKNAEKMDEELYRTRCVLSDTDVAFLLPSKAHGRFLKMFLGPVDVRAPRKEFQLKVKEEYNKYRVYLAYPSKVNLRENMCITARQKNPSFNSFDRFGGFSSNLGSFRWIYHHYCAMLMALVSLTWDIKGQPDCAYKQAKRMDVVWGETAGVQGQLWLLCPILFILQVFEAYVGVLLLRTALVGVVSEWQARDSYDLDLVVPLFSYHEVVFVPD
ncbi:transmembrane protein [Cocos nucifera]|uniref:Transmembrane protein n=1 Tax=Cocos nucifera TaxID=13894 RepID=A0A8K0IEE2_COCNU|nr:transmembrane protein [Cocos nucifera]